MKLTHFLFIQTVSLQFSHKIKFPSHAKKEAIEITDKPVFFIAKEPVKTKLSKESADGLTNKALDVFQSQIKKQEL